MIPTTTFERADRSLRILHVLRAPLGGLFRHVMDLAREQIARGHQVGLVTDSTTGGAGAAAALARIESMLALGLMRLPMRRQPHALDLIDAVRISAHARRLNLDVMHGHGSKGGLFARVPGLMPGRGGPVRAYTPHGGSFNHLAGPYAQKLYMGAERALERSTDIFLFESAFIATRFQAEVGETGALCRVILNGISRDEFVPIHPKEDADDLVYVGELRSAKGIDTLIEATAEVERRTGRKLRLVLVGSGPDKAKLAAQAAECGLGERVSFPGPMPARQAFALGQVLVVPSRAESLPYVVLEAAGAQMPMVATNVGGIGEIFGPYADRLIPCNDPAVLASALLTMLEMAPDERQRRAADLASVVSTRFTIADMASSVIAGYRDALARRASRQATDPSFAVSS